MPAAPPPTRAEVQGRAADFPRLFGAGSTVSPPARPPQKSRKGGGPSKLGLPGDPCRPIDPRGDASHHASDPCETVRIRSVDDRTERDGPWQLLV